MLSKSITYIQGEPFKDKKYHTCPEIKEKEFTFDQIQKYHIPYEQVIINWEKGRGAGTYARVYLGYIIQRVIDE